MVKVIRGFSLITGYNCLQCNFKCCATEYDLPLLSNEFQNLQKHYSFSNFLIYKSSGRNWLLRGDSCPFLDSEGLCLLHITPYKPLICQTYPLIFWKVKQDLILSWLNPCRGNGFKWITKGKNQILDIEIEVLIRKVQNNYKTYWGERIDEGNPFTGITQNRINYELNFFETSDNTNLVDELVNRLNKTQVFNRFLEIYDHLIEELEKTAPQKDLNNVINSVLHWLCWSPIGLRLSFTNSAIVFVIASLWAEQWGRDALSMKNLSINRERYLQQMGSSLATAILPSFWKLVHSQSQFYKLKRLAKRIHDVLAGEIPQENLIFLDY
jgi:Fe-S-cluster containining protein